MGQEMEANRPSDEDIVIHVDGVRLGMAPFVRQMVYATILAMLGSLKGVENPRRIDISLRVRRD